MVAEDKSHDEMGVCLTCGHPVPKCAVAFTCGPLEAGGAEDENNEPEPPKLTPWQRMRVYRNVAAKLRADGRTADADKCDEYAEHYAQKTVVPGEKS